MPLRLTKKHDGDVITFVRDDGSATSSRARDRGSPAMHDLMHYAVESTLGHDAAFIALLASGHDIDVWQDAKSTLRTNPPAQAIHAETIVGMLHLKWATEGPDALRTADPDELNAYLATFFKNAGAAPPTPLTRVQIEAIADAYQALFARWADTPIDATLELPWPPPPGASPHNAS